MTPEELNDVCREALSEDRPKPTRKEKAEQEKFNSLWADLEEKNRV